MASINEIQQEEEKKWKDLQKKAKQLLNKHAKWINNNKPRTRFKYSTSKSFSDFLQEIHRSGAIKKYVQEMYIALFQFEEELNKFLDRKLEYAFIDEKTNKYLLITNAELIDQMKNNLKISVKDASDNVGQINSLLKIPEEDWKDISFPYYEKIMERIRQPVGRGQHEKHDKKYKNSFYAKFTPWRIYSPSHLAAGDINQHIMNYVLAASYAIPSQTPFSPTSASLDQESFILEFINYLKEKRHDRIPGVVKGDLTFSNGVLHYAVKGNDASLESLNPGLKVALFISNIQQNPFIKGKYEEQLKKITDSKKFTQVALNSDGFKEQIEELKEQIKNV